MVNKDYQNYSKYQQRLSGITTVQLTSVPDHILESSKLSRKLAICSLPPSVQTSLVAVSYAAMIDDAS